MPLTQAQHFRSLKSRPFCPFRTVTGREDEHSLTVQGFTGSLQHLNNQGQWLPALVSGLPVCHPETFFQY